MRNSTSVGLLPSWLPESVTALSHLRGSPWKEGSLGLSALRSSRSHPAQMSGPFLAHSRIFWNQICCNACCWALRRRCQEEIWWQKKPFSGSPLQKLQKLFLVIFNPKSQDIFIILCSILCFQSKTKSSLPNSSAEWPRGTTQSNPLPRGKPQRRRGNTHALSRYWWLAV